MKQSRLTKQGKTHAKAYLAEAQQMLDHEITVMPPDELRDLHRSKLQRIQNYLEKLEALLAIEFSVPVPNDSTDWGNTEPEDLPF